MFKLAVRSASVALTTLAILTSSAVAADHTPSDEGSITLDVHLASYHSDRCYRSCTLEYNERNFGFGLTYAALSWLDMSGGFVRNSFDNNSTYATFGLNKDFYTEYLKVSPTLHLGITTGYRDIAEHANENGYSPVVLPSVTLARGRGSVNFGFIPSGFAGKSNVVTLRVGVKFR